MSNKPCISVIVPVYNVDQYLDRAVRSILKQTYRNLEIILIDDGSNDASGKICDKYKFEDKRIIVIHKKNEGLSEARNAGINIAKGEYITFVDSDDNIEADMIEYLFYLIKKFKTSMSICSHKVIYEKSNKIRYLGNNKEELLDAEHCLLKMLYHKDVDTSAWGKLYDIKLFKNIRYPKGKLFEDIGTTYKFFIMSNFIACGYKDKYNYYVRENSIVTRKFSTKKMDLLLMTDSMGRDVIKIFPNLKQAVLRRKVYARFSTLNQLINVDGYYKERANLIRFIKKYKWKILFDRLAPKRDKIAILLLEMGINIYKFVWNRR